MTTFMSVRTAKGYKNLVLDRIKKVTIDKDVLNHSISDKPRFAYRIEYDYAGKIEIHYTDVEYYIILTKDRGINEYASLYET